MRWTPGRRSPNLEDRRGQSFGGRGVMVGGGVGLGGLLVLLALSLLTGRDFVGPVTQGAPSSQVAEPGQLETTPEEERLVDFVSFVLDDAQGTWAKIFSSMGRQYEDAHLVLFRDAVESACGFAQSATGPFYCPLDRKVYIDLGFYRELRERFGADGGDFAQAYVITHELGHHVQNLLGIASQVQQLQESRPREANQYSVALELQADCLAGVWGHSTAERNILEKGDVEEALNAAAAIGDDRIQRMTRGSVAPESFTHGSSAQRVAWFRRGLDSGDVETCDTFGGR
jgi:uncharacterized protein